MHEMERQVRLLTSENQILRHKMDADALRLRQEKSSAKRDQQRLSAEIRKLNSESHTKALQVRIADYMPTFTWIMCITCVAV